MACFFPFHKKKNNGCDVIKIYIYLQQISLNESPLGLGRI